MTPAPAAGVEGAIVVDVLERIDLILEEITNRDPTWVECYGGIVIALRESAAEIRQWRASRARLGEEGE